MQAKTLLTTLIPCLRKHSLQFVTEQHAESLEAAIVRALGEEYTLASAQNIEPPRAAC